jgi:thioredoxin reductase (NADPH)
MNNINRESLITLADEGKVNLILGSNVIEVTESDGKPKVKFLEKELDFITFDYIVYALGGTTPHNFLKAIGIEFNGNEPVLKEDYETSVPGMFLLGDLSAGNKGGSIIWAFNSASRAIKRILDNYLPQAID